MGVPFDSIHLVSMSLGTTQYSEGSAIGVVLLDYLERLDRSVLVQLTHVDLLVGGAGGKTFLRLPANKIIFCTMST